MIKYSHQIKLKPSDLHSAWSSLQSPFKIQYFDVKNAKTLLRNVFHVADETALISEENIHERIINELYKPLSNYEIPTNRKKYGKNQIILRRNNTIRKKYHKYRHDGLSPWRAKFLLEMEYQKLSISYIDDIVKGKKNTI